MLQNTKKSTHIIAYILFGVLFSSLVLLFFFLSSYTSKKLSASSPVLTLKDEVKCPVIIIDAGHGGEDGGATGVNGVAEKDLNLEIAFELADMLTAAGYDVVLTRDSDRLLYDPTSDYKGRKKFLDLSERVRITEDLDRAILVSIHMNSFPDPRYSGLQVYYSKNHPESSALAESIQNAVRENLQKENDRTTKAANSRIFLLDRVSKPAVLVECAFLSNPEECELISEDGYRKKLTLAMFCGISDFIRKNSY